MTISNEPFGAIHLKFGMEIGQKLRNRWHVYKLKDIKTPTTLGSDAMTNRSQVKHASQ
jgi:hypothetical protein